MDGKAGDGVHHGARRDIDRHVRRRVCSVSSRPASRFSSTSTDSGSKRPAENSTFEHDLAFGDEPALAADEVALADVAIGGDARIGRVVDADGLHQASAGSGAVEAITWPWLSRRRAISTSAARRSGAASRRCGKKTRRTSSPERDVQPVGVEARHRPAVVAALAKWRA